MGQLLVLLLLAGLVVAAVVASRRGKERALVQRQAELAPVKRLVEEDVTALGTELQDLDVDVIGHDLDPGAHADYQRALDSYESAKSAADALTDPDQVRHVTEILDDGRYAMACVRARVAGDPLPTRRPACFFDPRHGLSVADVSWAPPGGVQRDVPACALDLERVRAGAEPDVRQVQLGTRRTPYYDAGPAYQPYAAGYFGMNAMNAMFVGMMFSSAFGGFGGGYDGYDGGGDGADGGGDGYDGGGGDGGGGDGGGWFGGDGDGGGFDFGGFDF